MYNVEFKKWGLTIMENGENYECNNIEEIQELLKNEIPTEEYEKEYKQVLNGNIDKDIIFIETEQEEITIRKTA